MKNLSKLAIEKTNLISMKIDGTLKISIDMYEKSNYDFEIIERSGRKYYSKVFLVHQYGCMDTVNVAVFLAWGKSEYKSYKGRQHDRRLYRTKKGYYFKDNGERIYLKELFKDKIAKEKYECLDCGHVVNYYSAKCVNCNSNDISPMDEAEILEYERQRG